MSQLNQVIQRQGFEVIKEQVGAILKNELENQKALQNFDLPINVFLDRVVPYDDSEQLMFNVGLRSYSKSNKSQYGAHVEAEFSIDVYTSSKQKSTGRADEISSNIRDRYIGLCDAILSSTKYYQLLFEAPRIMNTMVNGVQTYEASNNQDFKFVSMSRLTFQVKYNEDYETWNGLDFKQMITNVKIDLTEKGYKFELIN